MKVLVKKKEWISVALKMGGSERPANMGDILVE
jgi:hypothetical protein